MPHQFAQPGWVYLGGDGCAILSSTGSYVTLMSPDKKSFSVVIETMGASISAALRFEFPKAVVEKLHLWTSREGNLFVHNGTISAGASAQFSVSVPPNQIW